MGSLINRRLGSNCTKLLLGAGETYTGAWEDVSNYPSVICTVKNDVSGTLFMEFSPDKITTTSSLTYTIGSFNEPHRLSVTNHYFRVRYVNDSVAQTQFFLTTLVGDQQALAAPANLPLGQDADSIVTRSISFETDIAEGKRNGYFVVNKFGHNPDLDSSTMPEDVWYQGGPYTGFPAGDDELVTIVSSSSDDTAAGSGARTVRIYGLDTLGNLQDEVVTMNGTSLVDSVNTYTRLSRAVVLSSGTTNISFNVGTLTVAHKTTTANIFVAVPPGTNQSQVAAYTIPLGHTGYMRKIGVSLNKGKAANIAGAVFIRSSGASPKLVRIFSADTTSEHTDEIYGGLVLPELTDVAIRITSVSTTNVDVTANFDLIVVKD